MGDAGFLRHSAGDITGNFTMNANQGMRGVFYRRDAYGAAKKSAC